METTLEQVDQRQEVSSPTVTFAILEEEEDDEDEEEEGWDNYSFITA